MSQEQQTQTDNKTITVSSPGQPATAKPPKAKPEGTPGKGIPVGSTGKLFRFDS